MSARGVTPGVTLPLSVDELAVMSEALDTAGIHLAHGHGMIASRASVERLKEKVLYLLWALEDTMPSDPDEA